jgi:Ca-activated chloride channel family protein
MDLPKVDPLKYQKERETAAVRLKADATDKDELMTVKLRYKAPDADTSREVEVPVKNRTGEMSANVGFAAAVAEFGMVLRKSDYRGTATYADAAALARRFRGPDPDGYRTEFVKLVELAEALTRQTRPDSVNER